MKPSRADGSHPTVCRALRIGFFASAFVLLNACGRDSGPERRAPKEIWKEFSGEKAFALTEKLVGFGPRPSGSGALEKTRGVIAEILQQSGWQVEWQKFTDQTPRGPVAFVNLIARFFQAGNGRAATGAPQAIVASHYDTKWFDTIRFVGADDGGSSTGALLELARVLALDPVLARKIELVFFDGEEAVRQFSGTDGLYGSRFYARQLRDSGRNKQFKFGILWDMIGQKNLMVTLPPDSPPRLAKGLFEAADALGLRSHFTYLDRDLLDDHVPLTSATQANIPTIDLIGFDFEYWHTADDTLDKLSPGSLQTVGAVTLYYLRGALAK